MLFPQFCNPRYNMVLLFCMQSLTIEEIKTKALPVLKQAGVLRSSVFGSVARGEADENSDVDFLVELPDKATLFDLIGLKQDLEHALGKKVDVGTYDGLKPRIRQRVISEQVLIYDQ
jgi:predicted nucleotidyltransferase